MHPWLSLVCFRCSWVHCLFHWLHKYWMKHNNNNNKLMYVFQLVIEIEYNLLLLDLISPSFETLYMWYACMRDVQKSHYFFYSKSVYAIVTPKPGNKFRCCNNNLIQIFAMLFNDFLTQIFFRRYISSNAINRSKFQNSTNDVTRFLFWYG